MKYRRVLFFYVLMILMVGLNSCFNVFSVFIPNEPESVSDIDRLMSLGESGLNSLDYESAYTAYSNVVALQPTNSLAIEGMCTAYLYSRIPLTNLIFSIIEQDYGRLGFNTIYSVSEFLASNLYRIVGGFADGVVDKNDVNMNMNFFLFNTLYAAFFVADTDEDGNVEQDTNDLFVIYDDFSFTNQLPDTTNFVEVLRLVRTINSKLGIFTTLLGRSENSLGRLTNNLYSSEVLSQISNIRGPLDEVKGLLLSNISDISNLNAISQFDIGDVSEITNILNQNGLTNIAQFTNELEEIGITNMETLLQEVTNILPDLTNFSDLITNYFDLTNFVW